MQTLGYGADNNYDTVQLYIYSDNNNIILIIMALYPGYNAVHALYKKTCVKQTRIYRVTCVLNAVMCVKIIIESVDSISRDGLYL